MTLVRPLEELEILKISSACEMSGPFDQFLNNLTRRITETLTNVEIAIPNVI